MNASAVAGDDVARAWRGAADRVSANLEIEIDPRTPVADHARSRGVEPDGVALDLVARGPGSREPNSVERVARNHVSCRRCRSPNQVVCRTAVDLHAVVVGGSRRPGVVRTEVVPRDRVAHRGGARHEDARPGIGAEAAEDQLAHRSAGAREGNPAEAEAAAIQLEFGAQRVAVRAGVRALRRAVERRAAVCDRGQRHGG